MPILEIIFALIVGYAVLLLVVEVIIWKVQPDMEDVVTLFVNLDDTMVPRKLYGFDYRDKLYVSSNHWFRRWYHAVLKSPQIDVEYAGEIGPRTAVPVVGDERDAIAKAYKLGLFIRTLCGFAPRHFLRLDPRKPGGGT